MVLEGNFVRAGGYAFIEDSSTIGGSVSRYAVEQWEEAHDWQDVTGECLFHENHFWHVQNGIHTLVTCNGYRVRQVPVSFTGKGIQNGCQPGWAFIVEKQIP